MTYRLWSVSPIVMKCAAVDETDKIVWHYFWNQSGRRSGPITAAPERCAREIGLNSMAVCLSLSKLADAGLLLPIEHPSGPPTTGIVPPSDELSPPHESRWLKWKVPNEILDRSDLAPGPKLAYLFLWNKNGGRPGALSIDPKEIDEFFGLPG
jgi:hypothetical protein